MSPRLSEIFGELRISQYLDAFVDQGFDTWEAIQDITESDLDALGVKLGHRRKLQRRIANARGIPANAVLAAPTKRSVEDIRSEANKSGALPLSTTDGQDLGAVVVQKRKYRRHPKPDDNAPERPPSAYVLFSNKMRDDLKGQNLTFTEIAKLVGENWQGLTQAEKEPFERQAQAAKEKYNHDLAEYKQTAGYKKYLQYLQDFKAKHSNSHDKDGAKRVRISGSSCAARPNSHTSQDGRAGRACSIGEVNDGEPPPRRQRIGSMVSNGESHYAPSVLSGAMRTPTEESSGASSGAAYFDRGELSPSFSASPRDSSAPTAMHMRRDHSYLDGSRSDGPAPSRHLPSLSDMFDGRQMPSSAGYPHEQPQKGHNMAMLPRGYQTVSPAPTAGTSSGESRTPSLKTEQSSAGSISSGSSYSSYPRTPIEGPLPIHALLTNTKQFGPSDSPYATNPAVYRSMSPDERAMSAQYQPERGSSESTVAGPPMPHINGYYPGHPAVPSPLSSGPSSSRPYLAPYGAGDNRRTLPPPQQQSGSGLGTGVPTPRPGSGKVDAGLDGISALLQADRIVDRRPGDYDTRE